MYTRFAFAALVAALSGCGAGDNTGIAGTTSTAGHLSASAFSALRFDPATASATVPAGASRVVALDATINRAADFAGLSQIHVQLADDSVFQEAYVTPGASDKALVALYTAEKLTPGSYKGTLSLRLCKDEACTRQFAGSPVELPYAIEVQAGK
jgi:hypothetical protein